MRVLLAVAVVLAVLWGAHREWRMREYAQAPGVLVRDAPEQRALRKGEKSFHLGDYELNALASYRIRARLLRREAYRWDASAGLAPLDFALGWGVMSDSSVLDRLTIGQASRYYSWRFEGEPPAPISLIARSSANTHLIPAGPEVRESLDRMRAGQVIELDGYLVEVSGPGGFRWRSSLTRDDTGGGACEVLWVESARTL